jgi:hypothetical protein
MVSGTDGAVHRGDVCDVVDNFIIYNNPGTSQWGCTDVSSVDFRSTNLGQKIGYPTTSWRSPTIGKFFCSARSTASAG